MKFGLRTLFLLVAVAVLVALAIRPWLRPQSHSMTHAPSQLKSISEQHKLAIDFRCVTPYYSPKFEGCLVGDDGCHWRVKCNDEVVAAHIDAFSLVPAKDGNEHVTRMFRDFPRDWPKTAPKDLQWYVWPYNTGDSGDNYVWRKIMAIDNKNKTLYFFWQCFDYGG